jgi:hypothetical protein
MILNSVRVLWLALALLSATIYFRNVAVLTEPPLGRIGSTTTRSGAGDLVLHPVAGRSARVAGVREGDILRAVDGAAADTIDVLSRVLGTVGSIVMLDVQRGDRVVRIPVERSVEIASVLRDTGMSLRGWTWYHFLFATLPTVTFLLVGVLAMLRGWQHTRGVLLSLAFILIGFGTSDAAAAASLTSSYARMIVWGGGVASGAVLALLPDGRLVPRWGLAVIVGWAAVSLTKVVPGVDAAIPGWAETLAWITVVSGGAAAQVGRYRRATDETQRLQIRLVVFSFVAMAVAFVISEAPLAWFTLQSDFVAFEHYRLIGQPLLLVAIAMIPVVLAAAVVRHHLWNVDTVINRSAVYTSITLVLGLMWAASAVLLQLFLNVFIGGYSTIAAAAVSSLQVAALFDPLRTRVQRWVDERIPRESYVIEQRLKALTREVATSFEVDVVPLVDARLRVILATEQVQWFGGRVLVVDAPRIVGSKAVRSAIEDFTIATAPLIAVREAMRRALERAALPAATSELYVATSPVGEPPGLSTPTDAPALSPSDPAR